MATAISTVQLVAELGQVDGKAEIVAGRIVRMSPTGGLPSRASGQILVSLKSVEQKAGGLAYPDNAGYIVDLPQRKSFSPDVSFFTGPQPGMKFLQGAPDFAVEIRSEHDYGASAEARIAAKRKDYFAAGSKVVWDVDLLSEDVVRVYRADAPEEPTIYRKPDLAEAEPAVPGWTMPVAELFQ